MQQVAAGDRAAFARLMQRHIDRVHQFALRWLNHPADADDVAQECFLRMWQRADRFDPQRGSLQVWLLRLTRNLCIDRARASGRRPEGHESATPVQELAATVPAPDERLVRQRQLAELSDAIALLPERQRSALLLCRLQGRSQAEAAAVLGISTRALESLLSRARRSLRERLATSAPMTTTPASPAAQTNGSQS